MDGVNFLIKKLNNYPVIKVSLLVIIVALVVLSGIKIGEIAGKFMYYILVK
ncbi:hypothetical protein [Carboxydothermus hydrogenoformans]|uniref:Uncharacterized protein n=1 Tax=Carboxydothermus hydrogenoformans (strain ATCC BAA-161 / DSM 6008 / Z-2901) TaxID=246194 RepID=Q3AA52_CARHZ|nr:hypothetical protein [Carboxydothermus hydrogenoformans]ABB14200.1 hypothetical protein CHY_2168 [Carboxydothermus hydrogenoformans Z-2901]